MQKLSLTLWLLLVLLVSSRCQNSLPLRDFPLYFDMGPDGAAKTWTLHDEKTQISKADWDALRPSTVAMMYEDFGWLQGQIEKLCSDRPAVCTPQSKAMMEGIFRRVAKGRGR